MSAQSQASSPDNFAALKFHPSTIICREKTVILGDVTIDADCVIHPTACIIARDGPIEIGKDNLIEERVEIINTLNQKMIIGNQNVFEVDTYCEAPKVGNSNLFESKSKVCNKIEVSNNCIIGSGCHLSRDEAEKLPNNSVIYGTKMMRAVPNLPPMSQGSQLDFLRKILPNYQKLWRPNIQPQAQR